MSVPRWAVPLLTFAYVLAATGCRAPGKPKPGADATRPDQVLDFPTLYASNCAGCHGVRGKQGAALSLDNPVYLATAGLQNVEHITSLGVPGTMMPPFAKSSGGMLTDQQIGILSQGMVQAWGTKATLQTLPFAANSPGHADHGKVSFANFCARCHGADGTGSTAGGQHLGSLVDPAYLSLISNQGLRSIILAGMPLESMPDWRSDGSGAYARAMTDDEVTDTVAWLASHRVDAPGQFYREHP